jgi:hypothetical protein
MRSRGRGERLGGEIVGDLLCVGGVNPVVSFVRSSISGGRRASLGDEEAWAGMGCGWGGTEVKCDRVGWEFSCGRAESFMARRWKRGV